MRANSPVFDSSLLLNKEVIQIAVGLYSVEILLSDDVRISCQASFEMLTAQERTEMRADAPNESARLISLLGKAITQTRVEGGGHLVLTLGEDVQLKIKNSNDWHESYVVWSKGDFVAV